MATPEADPNSVISLFIETRRSLDLELLRAAREVIENRPEVFGDFDVFAAIYGIGLDSQGNRLSDPAELENIPEFNNELRKLVVNMIKDGQVVEFADLRDFLSVAYGIDLGDVQKATWDATSHPFETGLVRSYHGDRFFCMDPADPLAIKLAQC